MLLQGIILKCSSKIKEERTINAIYYLLIGKRSIQTVQDAHVYGLDRFYGILTKYHKSEYDQVIQALIQQKLIHSLSPTTCRPTAQGEKWLTDHQQKLPFTYFKGLTYHGIDRIFLKRLFLCIQVLTNKKMNHSSYIPITNQQEITNWMKSFYLKIKDDVNHCLTTIYKELYQLLHTIPTQKATMFVDRLTGFKHYGMSIHQLAHKYKMTENDVQLLFIGITHHILDTLQKDPKQYSFLAHMTIDLSKRGFMTQSARQTYKLIKQGDKIEQIVKKRRLKTNTIYDHIVEISLYDKTFSIDPYVNREQQLAILNVIKQLHTSKLKIIKDHITADINYFQIRLVLALIKGDNDDST